MDAESLERLTRELDRRMVADRSILDDLRSRVAPLRAATRRIRARTTTALSLVGTDGGINQLRFDPFLVHLIRVVDSNNEEYSLEAITPTTNIAELGGKQFGTEDRKPTPLGEMMAYLGVKSLPELSPMIRTPGKGRPASASWVQVYRELVEWATLLHLIRTTRYGSDTLFVFDGLLRSSVFAGDLFRRYQEGLADGIAAQRRRRRRYVLAGMAKGSKVLARYRLAMMLEQVLTTDYPAYVEIPREIEETAYVLSEYALGDDTRKAGGSEINRRVAGKMFFVKFGNHRFDPIWPVDIFLPQLDDAPAIFGFLLGDALNGFPVRLYPQCLQRAHEHAALVGFDAEMLQDKVFDSIRKALGPKAPELDVFRLQDLDPAQGRYERGG